MASGSLTEPDQRYDIALAVLERLAAESESEPRLDRALRVICDAVRAPLAKVLELEPAADVLRVRAGIGWREGVAGHAIVPAGRSSSAGYALAQERAVIFEDIQRTRRFTDATLLRSHNVTSGIAVRLVREGRAFGVLSIHELRARQFTSHDVQFLEIAATLVAKLM